MAQPSDGASRTRTGDLLGAISALCGPEFGLTSSLPSLRAGFPQHRPQQSAPRSPTRQRPGAAHKGAQSERQPVTPEVAGSSPSVPSRASIFDRVWDALWLGWLPGGARSTSRATSCRQRWFSRPSPSRARWPRPDCACSGPPRMRGFSAGNRLGDYTASRPDGPMGPAGPAAARSSRSRDAPPARSPPPVRRSDRGPADLTRCRARSGAGSRPQSLPRCREEGSEPFGCIKPEPPRRGGRLRPRPQTPWRSSSQTTRGSPSEVDA
jgi:hypothetical protein